MRSLPSVSRSAVLASLVLLTTLGGSARTFAAGIGTPAPPVNESNTGAARLPVPGHQHKTEEDLMYARVRDGVFTVNGMVAKIKLNYDVQGASFMYLFVPGVGTAVVSLSPAPDTLMTTAALHDDELSFVVDGHHFNLTGVSLATGAAVVPSHLYVHLDRSAWRLSRLPMIGFGSRGELPYEWPGALPPGHAEQPEAVPPVPTTLLPSVEVPAAAAPASGRPAFVHPVALLPATMR